MMGTTPSRGRWLAIPVALAFCASCSGPPAPPCDDGDVERLVFDLVRERISQGAPYNYGISPESLAELEGRIDLAKRRLKDLDTAKRKNRNLAEKASNKAWNAAWEVHPDERGEGSMRERADEAGEAAFNDAWPVKDQEASERAIKEALKDVNQARSDLGKARDAIAERAVADVLAADVELDGLITVERVDEARWSLCEATATVEVDVEPQGSVGGVTYEVDVEDVRWRTFDVQYDARYTADRKQVRVSLKM